MTHKLIAFLIVAILFIPNTKAQQSEDEPEKKPFFSKDKLFTGGSVGAGFGSGSFSLGLGPYFGMSLNKYVDVAATINYNYISQRDPNSTFKARQSIIGPGAFVRLYPVKFIFLQAQYEYNFVKLRGIYGVPNYPDDIIKYNVQSYLIGAGYASGREDEGQPFFFFSVLVDLSKDPNSPYVDQFARKNAILRTGINIPLFQGRGSSRRRNREEW
jgi:hypothetical protein